MTKKEWQEYYKFTDDEMLFFEYLISQGCKIIKILDKPLG